VNPFIRVIPAPLVRLFARPYVAGDSLAQAVDSAATLWQQQHMLTTLDLLAENIDTREAAEDNARTYLRMIDAVADDPRFADLETRPTLSLKPSSYTIAPLEKGGDAAGSRDAVFAIAQHARKRGVRLTVDMESRHWTDFTIQLIRDLHSEGHTHVGTVFQTRLFRTEQDLDALPASVRIRLVIGIYQEPTDVALADKRLMKDKLLELAERLLRKGHYVEVGTHDEEYVRKLVDEVVPRVGALPSQFEVQMLYGVPRERLQRELVERGIRVRLYVPFAIGWSMAIAYLRRRLDEYPRMMFLVAKNLVSRG
jgi:proline dehydrogenase